ncbi:phosphohistidine phosphatase [Kineosphaera limosa]|uniref:Putative phosphohistidine phosphatase n=1 Tax=Kineosphaera limosa NBRC 100340 TaxID=1184609 RepID=K6VPP8_9MICO|nr:histidine phosphatase family protein [Kineosphaera limosa]NYE00133.1 phosphohistidine phosphatase [Kineosphaera limosa]GAB98188.1 putative phosphohistidine phosphatase [Kineosphaera limosa NBRC 100340]
MPTLLLIRHAKSVWPHDEPDDQRRDLAPRGRRQAPEVGRWLHGSGLAPALAVVSPATRAQKTWELIAPELDAEVEVRTEPAAYAFSGEQIIDLVRALPADVECAAIVGHNPALEELAELLTGESVRLVTSALAVVQVPEFATAGDGGGTLRSAGRPASEDLQLRPF